MSELWLKYIDNVKPYFKYCENMSVLEIGPFDGWHTDIIMTYNPKSITLVEPNPNAVKILKTKFDPNNVIEGDIYKFAEKEEHFDVVVCCGVLYHFHSPVYLLEQIVNNFTPKYLIIESIFSDQENPMFNLHEEIINVPGNVFTNKRSARMTSTFHRGTFLKIMENLEYNLLERGDINVKNLDSKNSVTMYIFERL